MSKKILAIVVAFVLIGIALWILYTFFAPVAFAPTQSEITNGVTLPLGEEKSGMVEIIAQDLEIPWEITFLPGGELLVTERPGRLVKIGEGRTVIPIDGVQHVGEGGLQGMALHPDFAENQFIYLYLTTETGDGLENRIERYQLAGNELRGQKIIFEGIPGARFHDGGRIAFGPDGFLYAAVGDAGNEDAAQDQDLLAGSILRITDEGEIPATNPFGNAVYSYGHRNPQGLTWDDDGKLWVTEHGRSGALSGFDELNLIAPGANYGWPIIQGDEEGVNMMRPIIHSGASETWAPAGAVYWDESIFFTGLRGEALYEVDITDPDNLTIKAHLRGQFGRLRAIAIGPDGMLYISTSNQDGRGGAGPGDDRIVKINPQIFR